MQMEMSISNQEQQTDSIRNMFKENSQKYYDNVDYKSFEKYNQYNKHFSIINIIFNQDQQKDKVIGYYCIYQYENNQIKLDHYLVNGIWKINSQQSNYEQYKNLNILLEDLNNTQDISLDKQIETIIQRFDHYFNELNKTEKNQQHHNKTSTFSILKQDGQLEDFHHRSNQLSINKSISTPSTIPEVDEPQADLPIQSSLSGSNQILNSLTKPIKFNRIHQDSSSSSINSVKYTQSVRRRYVIQSILLRVQRKKKVFEKLINTFKFTCIESTIYKLGLEFLRFYDGIFNYPQGHKFVMNFDNIIWFLTIEDIKCVEWKLDQSEPRSKLILKYKNTFIRVEI